ncbi:glycoside hydrolase family 76 protein [Prevotella cerevisiae]|jgi:predicted alpha-1,6-mannanase (GH76 family)|uniref:Glycoside hydrolase family 76 protein n=1 Tax=Segatella cerevisiae TaxID=2053716 RepID=A0ABT1BVY4_9BACT|nr:glycoside hydrolase family 76 protein [Segatella cerevisiae]MCH3994412.1 glycoside hydrolase family 76 protein [Prevotella sp.]MCO6024568.1 glycoside hydrolase family 76 protein [Segatella cerevisiae]
MYKLKFSILLLLCSFFFVDCSSDTDQGQKRPEVTPSTPEQWAVRDLTRAIALTDTTVSRYFTGSDMTLHRYYNPYTNSVSSEVASVWMYTSAIEAVNSVMEALKDMKESAPNLYDANYTRYNDLLTDLYKGLEFYSGTYTLTSYTQTKQWTVYSVDRGSSVGTANVEGDKNVYDDQEWLTRELMRSYQITGKKEYLDKAEYLVSYILDGWDCTLDDQDREIGGITWGPSYVTKHSCSNAPLVSSLVWLSKIYSGKKDSIIDRKIDQAGHRYTQKEEKDQFYLNFAQKIYDWQKAHLMMSNGVYYDLIGATQNMPQYVTVDGVRYRQGIPLTTPSGIAYTYNSGTMLSGGADLYSLTKDETYLSDIKSLTQATFSVFAQKDAAREGYYSYPLDGFSTWFNDVLMRGYLAGYEFDSNASLPLSTFQDNLDYAYANYLYRGMLPTSLLVGWSKTTSNNNTEAMFEFAFASEYAMLSHYVIKRNK